MSKTNININISLVKKLVIAQFPLWSNLPIKPVEFDGWDNRTFRLGEEMAVRLPSAEKYASQVQKEHQWLPFLAPYLPLQIPEPLEMGQPADDYPWNWSIYKWIEGENATIENIENLNQFAINLAQFLIALQKIDSTNGPLPGPHNFYRGAPLSVYDKETWNAISSLKKTMDTDIPIKIWKKALKSTWQKSPLWLHGDISASNLLVKNGRLIAVIDFGSSGIGDPACDLTIAWTFFSGESREIFCAALPLDEETWARARGWALWKTLITLAGHINTTPLQTENARSVLNELLADYKIKS